MIELIGVPFDLTGMWQGSRLGPDALRLAGIADTLRSLGETVTDLGDLARYGEETAENGIRNLAPLASCVTSLRRAVKNSLETGNVPIVMGGEHAASMGGVSAVVNYHKKVALLWIDAHADVNTPATSPSGNMHGMPIAALWGLPSGVSGVPDREWKKLLDVLGPARLTQDRTAWIGLRDVDQGERPQVAKPAFCVGMDQIDRAGMVKTVDDFDTWMRGNGCTDLWISFDCDSLDPILAPGTGTAVRGGLSYREAHVLAELLYEKMQGGNYKLAGVDIMEVNPLRDTANMTALMTVEWVASLFGKTILGKR